MTNVSNESSPPINRYVPQRIMNVNPARINVTENKINGPRSASCRIQARRRSLKAIFRRSNLPPSKLYAFITRMPCRYSSKRFPALILASICRTLSLRWAILLSNRTATASGKATNMATAMRQSIQSKPRKAKTGITNAPINWGK